MLAKFYFISALFLDQEEDEVNENLQKGRGQF